MGFLKQLKIVLPYDLAIPFLCIYLKESKPAYNRDISMHMFIAALFTIVKLWNDLRCPSMNESIEKL
jgi:hypothetical protein